MSSLLILDDPLPDDIPLDLQTIYYDQPEIPGQPPIIDPPPPAEIPPGIPNPADGLPPDSRDDFNREIIYDIELNAWTLYDFTHNVDDPSLPRVHDYVPIPSYARVTPDGQVRVRRTINDRIENFKFLATGLAHISMAEYRDTSFKDWAVVDGLGYDYNSYVITGPITLDDFALKKQSLYITSIFWKTEQYWIDGVQQLPGGCKLQGIWDWHGSDVTWSKWTRQFDAYRLLRPTAYTGQDVSTLETSPEQLVITKNKLRGRGRSLILIFHSVSGKDMRLKGWHLPITQAEIV